ncbi:TPA: glucosaminidase domain-containing protein [Burkholderia vietnamiensis]|uniref:glucosaminidase domain-containing protein n=1 Tax=Burkholderia vietnamiensis TaxID=60552 RepID=UPI00265178B7|nr:glucosaminidase domain-containing protein [Burkholderia vietnamiensis]MDN8111246.1 glucosaminidase domain-containing protein [Burkholderia vietnamiensis]HDR9135983.1 glucosaminidase domain-containing protein [Burkholderia vietnamiensis]
MADSVVIREFLVALGFKVDEKGLKNFKEGVEGTTKGVKQLIATVSGAALTVSAGVAAFASKLERLYFVSQRTGASAANLRGFEFAARNMGVSAEAATGTIENLARFLRNNPAGEGYLATLGVQTRNANGELRDTVDIMSDLGKSLANKPTWLASQYGNILGIDENLLLAMRNGDFEKFLKQYREMSKTTGLDKAADDSHRFMTQLRGLGTTFENLGIRVEGAMLQKIGPQLERFQRWVDEHGDEIADKIGDIANTLLKVAEAAGPPLGKLVDLLLELDHATDGWSTKILLLGVALKALGVFKIAGGLWKIAVALRAGGAAASGATGLLSAMGVELAALASSAAAVGAAFLGWKIGDGVRDQIDGLITKLSGGRFRSLWDILTLKDRRGLDSTGGYTQAELDSVKDGGGAKLTPSRGEKQPDIAPDSSTTLPATPTRTPPPVAAAPVPAERSPAFLDRVRDAMAAARQSQAKTGVPWLVTFAQWALESGFGKKMPAGSNNPFGIKAKAGQPYVEAMTNEFINGKMTRVTQRFAKFDSLADAFEQHAKLLANGRPYAKARKHKDDAFSFADALTGVYATDPQYGAKLKSIMTRALGNSEWLAQGPQAPASAMNSSSGVGPTKVELHQSTQIHVNGSGDPAAAGRAVEREQRAVNADMVRNLQGVIA